MKKSSNTGGKMIFAGVLGAAVGGLIGYLATSLSKKEEKAAVVTHGGDVEIESFCCSICSELMVDPVMDTHGHCFCRGCIEDWMSRDSTCPMSREPISKRELRRCIDLASAIEEYRVKTRR
mmetsp:Transcript_6525/g.11425  ORF Transcript_6525/g.11425 Transcript_6525/m.11425 type:complete len:121 (+) Transcript_6525:5867-6229(+)|eukprot:CAMPEP_0204902422 /NCGR_PEP_ID=MMETSP1397-20131031/3657_1 /ASSEMBLY_ACC=CAM_ASM_000891 /TAXON_ID=49980 /ORGANISM="Climacostomum Climacostomum virens, Strain Stock W-24" /LENGTH=120 /DNA_ID=CAMNT_0052070925 /DNA_START=2169 /DNA_END=2531 /DNA_ORIENTATION=-